jgi:transcriptional regulator with XRE-family HTH domain
VSGSDPGVAPRIRLARNLRAAREAVGLSQTEAAKALGISRQTMNSWERERETAPSPGEGELEDLAHLYRTDVATLRYGDSATLSARGSDAVTNWTKEDRAWLARFRGDLIDQDATDEEVRAAEALLQSQRLLAFYRTGHADASVREAMQWQAPFILAEITSRHRPQRGRRREA